MACHNINDYAVIGDCHGIALIASDGRIDWCALPDIDSDPVLCRLLDDKQGGYLDTRPDEAFSTSRRYLPGTNVLETRLRGEHGAAVITDFMPVGRAPTDGGGGNFVQIVAPNWLIRVIDVTQGEMTFETSFRPCLSWGERSAQLRNIHGGVAWEGGCLLCDKGLEANEYWAHGRLRLRAGERARLILMPSMPRDTEVALASVNELLAITLAYWTEWSRRCRYKGPYMTEVVRSALTLKLLTYAPTGAIAAAATTSLPEVLGQRRNWDYRLSWVRDSTLTLFALAALGYHEEPEAFFHFVFQHAADGIIPSQIVYGLHGERELVEREKLFLEGFSQSKPVRVGNDAYRQKQFDVFGELFDWMLLRQSLGVELQDDQRALLRRTADYVATHWREPCSDFWEGRGAPGHHVYSKLMSWVALDRAQKLLQYESYVETMNAIVTEVHRHGIATAGYLRQQFDRNDIDALALRAPFLDFPLPPGCLQATLEEVSRQLDTGTGIYRYREGSGGAPKEGSFVACGFWLVDALLFAGRIQDARERLEKMLSQANDVGLYAEEVDPGSGRHLGNFPQALSHLGLIHSATLLEIVEHHGEHALAGTHSHRAQRANLVMEALCEANGWRQPAPATDSSVLDLAALLGAELW
ncbi:glycoside hydrolase family 15 protein [Dyella acidiphila]|uniref:Glycoside hydrolase family 15 protein n=1 Tax=Dyella acidiphila TaxID=2775866 RepID=A0ABR9GBW8_9GAMM|nr:glycoside hydrolase family 15 protein [Dyella acidiphila]MBE1161547.1 glycoside hydrolase family 15 protein [Dyella acidiphila]